MVKKCYKCGKKGGISRHQHVGRHHIFGKKCFSNLNKDRVLMYLFAWLGIDGADRVNYFMWNDKSTIDLCRKCHDNYHEFMEETALGEKNG